ncbi:unnamed protein product [Schistosoma margrebowiei]|uniref:Uncharacterized protein n=1 Tax=Schistosoma margrebowiei TaxID=48269 RepID=A0AA85AM40_9TREM|nr:unnamed protein product [Schistosoma margrebowiei]
MSKNNKIIPFKLGIVDYESSMMMKFAFDDASTETSQDNSSCIFSFNHYKEPVVLNGLILTMIGLILGLLIMLNKKLHITSTKNSLFMVITMIFLDVGVALLMSVGKWYEQIISVTVATALLIIAILLGVRLDSSERKWMILLCVMCGVFMLTGIILIVLWVIFRNKYLIVVTLVCWCGAMFIVIIFTTYYLPHGLRPRQHLNSPSQIRKNEKSCGNAHLISALGKQTLYFDLSASEQKQLATSIF